MPKWICKQLGASAISDAILYFAAVQITAGPDTQYLLTRFSSSVIPYVPSNILLTVTLAMIVLDAVLVYHDDNLQSFVIYIQDVGRLSVL